MCSIFNVSWPVRNCSDTANVCLVFLCQNFLFVCQMKTDTKQLLAYEEGFLNHYKTYLERLELMVKGKGHLTSDNYAELAKYKTKRKNGLMIYVLSCRNCHLCLVLT